MPKEIAFLGDRIFLMAAMKSNYAIDFTDGRTVAYRTAHALHYIDCRLPAPPGSKAGLDYTAINRYLTDPANHEHLFSTLGFVPIL